VSLAIQSPPPTPEYLNWSDHKIEFSREDHPPRVPRPGHVALVLQAQIGGFDVGRVFIDAESGINLIYAKTLRAMNISLTNLVASDTSFHGIALESRISPWVRLHSMYSSALGKTSDKKK
jgi:hypothetical protein